MDGVIDQPVGTQIHRRGPMRNINTGGLSAGIPGARGRSGQFIATVSAWTECDESGNPVGAPDVSRVAIQPFGS